MRVVSKGEGVRASYVHLLIGPVVGVDEGISPSATSTLLAQSNVFWDSFIVVGDDECVLCCDIDLSRGARACGVEQGVVWKLRLKGGRVRS